MRSSIAVLLFCILAISSNAQNAKITLFEPTSTSFKNLGAIHKGLGLLGERYALIVRDYGGRFDLKNNIETKLSLFSLKTGQLDKTIDLNQVVADQQHGADDIFFCDVAIIHDQIIGVYTFKNKFDNVVPLMGMLCDANGKAIRTNIPLGDVPREFQVTTFGMQNGLALDGRNILALGNILRFHFSPDSSKFAFRIPLGKKETGRVEFRVVSSDLLGIKKIALALPTSTSGAYFTSHSVDNNGRVYVAIVLQGKKGEYGNPAAQQSMLLTNSTENIGDTRSMALDMGVGTFSGLVLVHIHNNGTVFLTGTYNDINSDKHLDAESGVFSSIYDQKGNSLSKVNKLPFPDSLIALVSFEKPGSKGFRVEGYAPKGTLSIPGGGIAGMCRSDETIGSAHGSTGALNSYHEYTYGFIYYLVSEQGVPTGTFGKLHVSENISTWTRSGRVEYAASPSGILVVDAKYTSKHPSVFSIVGEWLDRSGHLQSVSQTDFPHEDGDDFQPVENTLVETKPGEYVGALLEGRGKDSEKGLRIYQIKMNNN